MKKVSIYTKILLYALIIALVEAAVFAALALAGHLTVSVPSAAALAVLIAATLAAAHFLARYIIKPIQVLTAEIQRLDEYYPGKVINLGDVSGIEINTELVQLAESFNKMITDIKAITEQKEQAERINIREQQRIADNHASLIHLNNILNGVSAMICATDPETDELIFINDEMRRIFNVSEDYGGQICYKTLRGLDKRCAFCPCDKLDINSVETLIWEQKHEPSNRVYRSYSRYVNWLDGKRVHIQYAVDMTDNIKTELELAEKNEQLEFALLKAETANKAKSAFLANMSHEIRTPMNAILGITEMQLRDKALPKAMEENLARVYDSGHLLLNIINDILDLSKIEAGKLEILPTEYDIPSLINDTVQLNRIRYENKPIEFLLDIDENTPLNLYGDELRLKQILGNILSNAFKYTDKGSIKMSISSEAVPPGSKYAVPYNAKSVPCNTILIISISDTGQGMSAEQIETLFDEYTRFNTEANRTTIGTGLGMSITKRLVDLMNGEIFVKSEVNQGSIFTVCIPQVRLNNVVCGPAISGKLRDFRYQSTSIIKKSRMLREYMPYGSVLVVDDVESNLYVTRGMLLPYGLEVETVNSGYAAIDLIRKEFKTYDVIFMDHMMPDMDGIETVKIIRQMGYKGCIIALTANALVGQSEVFLQNGFDGYISKPIDSRELNLTLIENIRNKKPPDVVRAARREQREQENTSEDASGRLSEAEITKYFIIDAEHALDALKSISRKLKNNSTLCEPDLHLYEITVHGMKSALLNLDEKTLSDYALKLELAAIEHNYSKLISDTPEFMERLRDLVKILKKRHH